MKKLVTTLAVFVFAVVFSTQSAEARGHKHHNHSSYTYVSGHSSCGCKIYTKRYVRYYDCHGYPVYGYTRQPVKHRCHKTRKHRRSYNSYNSCGSDYGYYNRRRSYSRRSSCGSGSGWSVSYRF